MSEAETVAQRWERDRARFAVHAERIRTGQARFRSVLPLLDAYNHIDRVERMTADLANAMALAGSPPRTNRIPNRHARGNATAPSR